METVIYTLQGIVPFSEKKGIDFNRLELLKHESSPLALVWYKLRSAASEKGARIDLQKQVFLDDCGELDRSELNSEARLIVHFVQSLKAKHQPASALTAGAVFSE